MGGRQGNRAIGWWRAGGRILAVTLAGTALPAAAVTGGAPGAITAVQPGLQLTASGEMLYDSNQLRGFSTLNSSGHRDDFRYSPAANATYNRDVGRLVLSVNGLVGRDFFQYNTYLNRNRYDAGGSLTYRSGASCQAVVNGNYANRQSGIRGAEDAAIIDPTVVPDDVGRVIDNVQTSSVYGANASCGSPSGRLSFGGGYTHSELNNGAATRKFADSDSDTYSGNIGVGILRPGQLSLTGSYSTIAYPDRLTALATGTPIPPQLLNTGVNTYRVGLAFSRPIGTRLSGSIGASYLHATPSGGQAPYSSPAYNLGLNYTAGPRLSFSLSGSRDIIASTTAGALFRVVDQILLTSNYTLGRSITLNANAGLIQNSYRQPFAIVGEPVRRNDMTKTAGVGATYAPRSLYDVTLYVSQTFRTSDPSIFNYDSTKASITLAVHY